jgi:hypothetical protein
MFNGFKMSNFICKSCVPLMTLLNVNIQFRKEQVHSLEDIAKMGKIPYKIVV